MPVIRRREHPESRGNGSLRAFDGGLSRGMLKREEGRNQALHARARLAATLDALGDVEAAIGHYLDMLRLNPGDNRPDFRLCRLFIAHSRLGRRPPPLKAGPCADAYVLLAEEKAKSDWRDGFDRGVGLDPAGQLAHLPERRPPVEGSQGRCFIPGEAFDRRFGSGPVDALIADLAHPPVNGGVGVLPQGRRRGQSGAWDQSVQ